MKKIAYVPNGFIPHHYITIATLMVLLDKSALDTKVKKQCKTGLKIIEIIYEDINHNTKTKLLSDQKFDAFFNLFPDAYFKNRALLPANTIIKNITLWITTNCLRASL
jgi:hypothetical protein